MNYIAEIKAFHDLVMTKQLSTGQIALWYALMSINNKCAWAEWFSVPNLTLELNTGLSRSGVLKAKNTLRQHGVIEFKFRDTKATMYKMISLLKSTQDSTQISTQDGTQNSTQSSTQIGNTLNKLNETKLNKEKINKKEVDAFFDSVWLLYPEKKGKGQVGDKQRGRLFDIGYEHLKRCMERYLSDLKKDSWRKPQNGSTFFNSGYVDYLDENYTEQAKQTTNAYEGVRRL